MGVSAVSVAVAAVVWLASGVWLAVHDLRTGLLPTRVIWPTAGAVWALYAVASLVEAEPAGLIGAALGAAVCGAILAAVHFAHPPSMGFGDVRLSVLNGLLCGWWGWQFALAGLLAGFALALPEALIVIIRQGMRASRPLGPYLVAGTAVAVVWAMATRGLVTAR
jgi:leader peptidase (prepilin peptidase)/N-methyltransferase